eukprot:1896546-Rhodomonas_salina.1
MPAAGKWGISRHPDRLVADLGFVDFIHGMALTHRVPVWQRLSRSRLSHKRGRKLKTHVFGVHLTFDVRSGTLEEGRPNGDEVKADLTEVRMLSLAFDLSALTPFHPQVIWHTKCVVEATRKLSERLRPLDAIAAFVRHSVGNERTPTPSPGPSPLPAQPDEEAVPEEEKKVEETPVVETAAPEPETEPAEPKSHDVATDMVDADKYELRPKVETSEMSCQTDPPAPDSTRVAEQEAKPAVTDEGVQTEAPEPAVEETPTEDVAAPPAEPEPKVEP